MRKLFTGIIIGLIAIVVIIYLFIPSSLAVGEVETADCTVNSAFRSLSHEKNWAEWWPGQATDSSSIYHYKGNRYQITEILRNTFHINIQRNGEEIPSTIFLLPLPHNSVAIQWKCTISAGNNLFTKLQRYRQARNLKNNMSEILQHLQTFLKKRENVYGLSIHIATTSDTLLIATNATYKSYPSTQEIYSMIGSLQAFAATRQASQTGPPMLNVTMMDSAEYRVQTAIPVNKVLEDEGRYFFRRMVPGKFITAEVTGGIQAVNHAWKQMQLFLQDYREVTMAMPFEYLVTDRLAEPDSSHWITRLFVPVYYEVDPGKQDER